MGGLEVRMGDAKVHLRRRLIDGLYTDAMLLADEARGYFDEAGRDERNELDPMIRVAFSCESLKVTTRLMHVIAWLLTQRAVDAGELAMRDALDPSRRLGGGPDTELEVLMSLPMRAQGLIVASMELHRRVGRLDSHQTMPTIVVSPARMMQERLAAAL
jgi:regulator of CtrA degradation